MSNAHIPMNSLPLKGPILNGRLRWVALVCCCWLSLPNLETRAGDDFVQLTGPEAYKLNWDTRALRSADLNNDGLLDLVVINNSDGRIDFLMQQPEEGQTEPLLRGVRTDRWEPVLDDTRFQRESLGITTTGYSLELADFNQNGKIDIVFTGADPALTVRYQLEEGGFAEPVEYNRFSAVPWTRSMAVVDLASNGNSDLILIGRGEILIFRQGPDGLILEPETIPLTGDASGLIAVDVNQNGRKDILYLTDSNRYPLRLRFQDEEGRFGPEYSFDLQISRGNLLSLPNDDSNPHPRFSYIESRSHHLKTVDLVPKDETHSTLRQLQPRIYPVLSGEGKAAYTIGNFDGSALPSIVAAHPTESYIALYPQGENGDFLPPIEFPSLTGITGLGTVKTDNPNQEALLVFSQSENFIGVTSMTDEGRFSFPTPLPDMGEPVAFTIGTLGVDETTDSILFIGKDGRDHKWFLLKPSDENASGFTIQLEEKLEGVRRPPDSILLADLNGNGMKEWIVLFPREPARIFSWDGLGPIEEISTNSSIRRSLLNDLNRAKVNIGDPVGDGRERLLVAGQGYIRSIALDENRTLVVEDQFNTRAGNDVVTAPLFTDIDGNGIPDLLLYESREGAIQWIRRDEDGVFRYHDSKKVGPIQIAQSPIQMSAANDEVSLIFWGNDRFWHYPLNAPGWKMEPLETYETDLRNVTYSLFASGILRKQDTIDYVMIDGTRHIMELLGIDKENNWKSLLHFPIFDRNLHYQGRSGSSHEPREVLLCDITGNGLDDILLLVHDRILLYPNTSRD